jgi:hypothetical protein
MTGSLVVEQGRERLVALESTTDVACCTQCPRHGVEESVDARVGKSQSEQARCSGTEGGSGYRAQEMVELGREHLLVLRAEKGPWSDPQSLLPRC